MDEKSSVAAECRGSRCAVRLILRLGGLKLRAIPLSGSTLAIGRRPYNDLVLDDLTASGEHAVIQREGVGHVLRDLDSRNGTRVNGQRVTHCLLKHGDVIAIGVYSLDYESPPAGVGDDAPGMTDGARPLTEDAGGRP